MSLIRRAFGTESRSALDDSLKDGTYGMPGFGNWANGMAWQPGSPANGGTVSSAMQISAVWACLRLLVDAISTLPLDTYRRESGARLPHRPRPQYLDFDEPGLSRVQYLTQVMLSLLTDGNAFVATPRNSLGEVIDLFVLDPSKVVVRRKKKSRVVEFVVGEKAYNNLDIMHVLGLTLPGGVRGVSPIAMAREVVDSAGEAQRFGRSFFHNSSVPPAVIKIPASEGGGANQGKADSERAQQIAKAWHDTHGGTSNAGKIGVLVGGAELQSVALANKDSQWLESRQFSVQEIARIFGVPPHLIADSSNSTSWGSGLAEQNLAFGQFSLRPWTERIEEAHNRLLASEGMREVFMKLNLDALLRASLEDRYKSYQTGLQSGFLTPNEARRWEDLPPVEGGDVVLSVPVGASPEGGRGALPPAEQAKVLQQLYLAVGKVITADEARTFMANLGFELGADPFSPPDQGGST